MKLPNGYGSIYRKKGNRRKPYVVVVTVGWTEAGKQIRKILSYVKSPKEGLKVLAKYHHDPYDLNFKNITFGEIWKDVLHDIENLVEIGKMSDNNLRALTSAFNNHLKPLHKEKILELRYKKMQDLINNSKKLNSDEELGYTARGYMVTVCKKIFEKAINEYELPIDNDPSQKLSAGEKTNSDKHIPFTDEQISILWGLQYRDLVKTFIINIYTGLRPNELFKTHRDNIHLDENYFITGSKTNAGKDRIIPIHPKIKHLIEYFYNNGAEYPFQQIFEKFNYNKFSRESTNLMEELGFENTPYDCRHTFITRMKQVGADEYILKLIVGHKINDITEKVYTHRTIEEIYQEILKLP